MYCCVPWIQQSAYLDSKFRRRCILDCRHTCNWLVFRQHTLQLTTNKWLPRGKCWAFYYSFDLTHTSACVLPDWGSYAQTLLFHLFYLLQICCRLPNCCVSCCYTFVVDLWICFITCCTANRQQFTQIEPMDGVWALARCVNFTTTVAEIFK